MERKSNMESQNKSGSYNFLLIALTLACLVVYFIARPFLSPLILAAVFAYLFQPVYMGFLNKFKNRANLASLATTLVAIILIMIPLVFLGSQIFKESTQLYQNLTLESGGDFSKYIDSLSDKVLSALSVPEGYELDLGQYAERALEVLVQNFGAVFSSIAKILFSSLVFLITFFFFLKDGPRLKKYLVALSPLDDKDDELIASRLKQAVSAAIKGNLTIGIVQGILTGIGFAIFGVPNAVLWGGVAAIAALLPGIGTALVIIPGVAFLFLTGNTFGGVALLIWGMTAVGLIDNFLGPKLVGKDMKLHPLMVFISVIGGLAFFGPLGFLLGPLAVSVCIALVDIYVSLKGGTTQST